MCQLTVSSAAIKPKPMSCNQSERSILVPDLLELTGLSWVAVEVDKHKCIPKRRQSNRLKAPEGLLL